MDTSLSQYICHPETMNELSLNVLRRIVNRYPFFQPARLLFLRNLYQLHAPEFDRELRKAALYIQDRKTLFWLIEGEKFRLSPHKAQTAKYSIEEESGDRTGSLIDHFLSSLPKEKPKRHVAADASTDYIAYMMQMSRNELAEGEAPRMQHQELIDNFIGQGERKFILSEQETTSPEDIPTTAEDSGEEEYFTLTLAKIYIKQEKYAKALEIIRKLNLKYPKKNRYFADQIRFLEKLIINNKYKNT